jgi:FAD/FMN-containing dehydrogenase
MSARSAIPAPALSGFRQLFSGQVVLPGDADYDSSRVVWNAMADRRPAVIARCAGSDDVRAAVQFARDHDLVIAVRGGGHSVAGYSTCDDGLVIDLSLMRSLVVDPERLIATVDGGALLSQLDGAAQEFGLACPVGVIGHTGVAGLALGGGMGRLQRKHGFTIDNILGVDIVTADGRMLRVSSDENADLFWGIRGAGANFGVVTSFKLRLYPVGPTVTHGFAVHPIKRLRDVGALFREFVATAPDDIFLNIGFGLSDEIPGRAFVGVGAMHAGAAPDAERVLEPLRKLKPAVDTFGPKPYLALQSMSDEAMAWGKRFYMKGGFVNEVSGEVLEVCAEQIARQPGTRSEISFWAQGGAVGRVPAGAMAFMGRDAGFWLGVETLWEDPAQDDAHISWGRATMAALKPFTTAGQYVNDAVESDVAAVRGIYGNEKYERLVGLKRAYDPDNVFRLNANIRP